MLGSRRARVPRDQGYSPVREHPLRDDSTLQGTALSPSEEITIRRSQGCNHLLESDCGDFSHRTAVGPFRHLAGEDMGCIDAISCDKPHSFPPDREIHLSALPAAQELFAMLDPRRSLSPNLLDHAVAMSRVASAVGNVLAAVPKSVHLPALSHSPSLLFRLCPNI